MREAAGSVGRQRTQTSGRVRPRSGRGQRGCCDCRKIWALAAARQPCARSAGAMACPRPSRRHSAYATSHRGRGIHGGVTLIPRHHTHRISLHEATATSNQSQKAAQTPVRRVYEAWSSEPGAPRQLAVGHQCTSRGGEIRAKVYRRESTLKLGPWITKHSYRKGTIGPPSDSHVHASLLTVQLLGCDAARKRCKQALKMEQNGGAANIAWCRSIQGPQNSV